MNKRLHRSRTNRMIGVVCGGIAEYLGTDPTVIRLIWALGTLFIFPVTSLMGVLGYLVAWLIIPEASPE